MRSVKIPTLKYKPRLNFQPGDQPVVENSSAQRAAIPTPSPNTTHGRTSIREMVVSTARCVLRAISAARIATKLKANASATSRRTPAIEVATVLGSGGEALNCPIMRSEEHTSDS